VTAPDAQALYVMLGRLLSEVPDLGTYEACATRSAQEWLGKAFAITESVGSVIETSALRMAISKLQYASWATGVKEVFASLYRTLAVLELRSPASVAGAFIPVGSRFDAFQALSKVFASARQEVLIVDPYMDESALTEFGTTVPVGVRLRLLADENAYKASLAPAAAAWMQQYGTTRPLEVRIAAPRLLHDRTVFVDGSSAWTLTQSLKDFAKRSPAEIVKAGDTEALKIAAYGDIWATAKVLA
jgi:hypothetical protein